MPDLQLKEKQDTEIELRLIKRSQSGDEQAFGELYDIWAGRVYRFVFFKVKNTATAEDLTSEIFLKAWQKIHQYKIRSGANFSSWLYTVARNSIIDHYRMNRKTEISFEDLPEIADLEGPEPFAEELTMERALRSLPDDYERVLRLRFVEDLPIAKVAQKMKKKESNVRAITHRALKKLKEELEK
ncbi:hypothetical protein DRH29_01375 [candidate division Kazan bacterium]|uniref:RNA polymerase subunit sigma-70 n=1 Tax=candidate division Kazan bacterium TaxID=2202143 RepID=A0A420ZDT3_UNCK3|nr:MAG: hypothetical protein DRH29_01375 [candidate division Kazan bacterium]